MRNLTLPSLRAALRTNSRSARWNERGAVGVLVGILFAGGVVLGMGAMVVDTGELYVNRAELQNGADAGAIAIANQCALNGPHPGDGSTLGGTSQVISATGGCSPAAASHYANSNASKLTGYRDGVKRVCGSETLGTCPASTGKITDCPPAPSGANYVDVHTETKTAGGSLLLPPVFARSLLGNSKYRGTTVLACGQAQWGPPATATTTAITIAQCAFDNATNGGTSFAPTTPSLVPSSDDQVINLMWGPSGSGCDFGWTADAGNCQDTIASSPYIGDAGGGNAHPSATCEQALASAQQSQKPIYVPIFSDQQDTCNGNGPQLSAFVKGSVLFCGCGNPTESYTLEGFAAFVVTGYGLPGFSAPDWLNPDNSYLSGGEYISGYFTTGILPSSGEIGGTDLGVEVVKLTG